jgi:tetratricopeptide (TPR) repeat protein
MQVCVTSVLGSPITGGVLLAHNAKAVGQLKNAKKYLWTSIVATIVMIIACSFLLPERVGTYLIPVSVALGMGLWYRNVQGGLLASGRYPGAPRASWWPALGISILVAVTVVGVSGGLVFVADCSASYLKDRGYQKYAQDDPAGAVTDYSLALILSKDFAIYANRATAEIQLNRLDDAIRDYHHARDVDPTNAQLFIVSGLLKERQNKLADAIADYNQMIRFDPNHANNYLLRSSAKRKLGDLDGAIADASKAIELNPTNARAYNDQGWTEFRKNNYSAAITDATHSIELNPVSGDAFGTRGWTRYGQGDVVGAIEDCKRAVALHPPGSPLVDFDGGMLAYINHDYAKAIATWKNVIAQDASYVSDLQPWINNAQMKLP